MRIFIIICMFIATLYAVSEIKDNAKQVEVGQAKVKQNLTAAGCLSMAVVVTGFNAACVYLLACVV